MITDKLNTSLKTIDTAQDKTQHLYYEQLKQCLNFATDHLNN